MARKSARLQHNRTAPDDRTLMHRSTVKELAFRGFSKTNFDIISHIKAIGDVMTCRRAVFSNYNFDEKLRTSTLIVCI